MPSTLRVPARAGGNINLSGDGNGVDKLTLQRTPSGTGGNINITGNTNGSVTTGNLNFLNGGANWQYIYAWRGINMF